jgi:hypothetical protein
MKRHKPRTLLGPPYPRFLNDQYEVSMLTIFRTLILGFIPSVVNFKQLPKQNIDHDLLLQICSIRTIKNNFNYPNVER